MKDIALSLEWVTPACSAIPYMPNSEVVTNPVVETGSTGYWRWSASGWWMELVRNFPFPSPNLGEQMEGCLIDASSSSARVSCRDERAPHHSCWKFRALKHFRSALLGKLPSYGRHKFAQKTTSRQTVQLNSLPAFRSPGMFIAWASFLYKIKRRNVVISTG
jgi:hypothetical protein